MVLKVPEAGLQLESSAKAMAALPAQAFAITLSDSIIDDLLECAQLGQEITLSLGSSPALKYGSSTHFLPQPPDLTYDLYLSDPSTSSKTLEKLPNPAMSLFRKPELNAPWSKKSKASGIGGKDGKTPSPSKTVSAKQRKVSVGLDADIAQLESSLALKQAEKLENSTKVIEAPPPSKKGAKRGGSALNKILPTKKGSYGVAGTTSLPGSPALSALGSPNITPTLTASQQAAEKAKQARLPIIHELAFKEQTYDNLWQKYPGLSEDEFKTSLEKVADLDKDSQNYVLKKMYWKELDVWNHEYASDEERQQAIDNAIRQYDKMRLTASEPEWQKLLPKEERGKGKCLSKVQANIARGPPPATPKIKVQKAEESGPDSTSSSEQPVEKKVAQGGEAMVRSSSNPLTKAKKPTAREAQEKRLLSKKKTATPKVSPTKPGAKAAAEKPGKYKSKEIISDSDSSDMESAPLATTVHHSKLVKKPAEKSAKAPTVPKPKPKTKTESEAPIRAQIRANPLPKRPREDSDSSSSSGTPLSKRFKTKEIKAAPAPVKKHRASDGSQNSRGTSSGLSFSKSKDNSPAKSSPLASSPPTNASDLDPAEEHDHISTKRKAADYDSDSKAKRQRLSQDLVNKAVKFKVYYEKYEALHREMSVLENPPQDKVADLLEMRNRLKNMKSEIYKEVRTEV